MMPRKLHKDGLVADISSLKGLIEECAKYNDQLGLQQYEQRLSEVESQLSELGNVPSTNASLALLFGGSPVFGSRGINADFAGKVLNDYQELLSKVLVNSSIGKMGERGPIPAAKASKLMVTELARGSFGFVLDEISDQIDMVDSPLKIMVEEVSEILSKTASNNSSDFEELLNKIDQRILLSLRNFFIDLDKNEATLKLIEDDKEYIFDEASIHRARERTESTNIEEETEVLIGKLIGFLPVHKKFELKIDSGDTIFGTVADEAVEQFNKVPFIINQNVSLKSIVRTTKSLNNVEKKTYKLVEFLPPFNEKQ